MEKHAMEREGLQRDRDDEHRDDEHRADEHRDEKRLASTASMAGTTEQMFGSRRSSRYPVGRGTRVSRSTRPRPTGRNGAAT
jgi:hypothetical protein